MVVTVKQILWVVCLWWVKKSPSATAWLAMKPVGSARQALTRRVYGPQHLRSCSLGGCKCVRGFFQVERFCSMSPAWKPVTRQQLQLCEGGGMPGALWPGQSWGFAHFQPWQPKTILPDLAGRENRAQRAHRDMRQPSGPDEATDQLGADETHPLSEWMSSFYRGSWLGEVGPDTGQSKTVPRRLKWLQVTVPFQRGAFCKSQKMAG